MLYVISTLFPKMLPLCKKTWKIITWNEQSFYAHDLWLPDAIQNAAILENP